MPTLHLGVLIQPYADENGKTTGDVAEILEEKYHVMEHFSQLHGEEIATAVGEALEGSLETMLIGGKWDKNAFASAESEIENMFRKMLSEKELDKLGYPGIPTQAALKGVSHRRKRPYVRRGPRPSFLDTTLFSTSFRAWTDE